MLNYKQIWHGIKPIRWLNKFNLTHLPPINPKKTPIQTEMVWLWKDFFTNSQVWLYLDSLIHYCKVEFNQPSCWLYSVPNLLVFQQLDTLYLGGFVVRVVSEIECWMLKSVQENRVLRLDLAGDLLLQAARSSTRAKHAGRWTVMLAGAL